MAGRKDAAGRRRARPLSDAPPDPIFIVHDLAGVMAALDAARAAKRRIVLRSPPGAIHAQGLGYLAALFELAREHAKGVRFTAVIDCDNDAALAHRALVLGFKEVAFRGHTSARRRLESVASQLKARLVRGGVPRGACALDDPRQALALAEARLARSRRLAKPGAPR